MRVGRLVLAIAVLALGGARLSAVHRAVHYSIEVIVHDRARVVPAAFDEAKKETSRILRQAGVRIVWRIASGSTASDSDREAAPTSYTVQMILLPKVPATGGGTSAFLMGAAPPVEHACAALAYVFHDEVLGASNVQNVKFSLVLGTVMAHEIGHGVLKDRGHAPEGLMRAPWNVNDWQHAGLGLLLFTPAEAAAIHATMSSCVLPATSGELPSWR
jgi:hypothetical protein